MIRLKDILNELEFKSQAEFDAYAKQHDIRPSTKVTIAGRETTAGQAMGKSDGDEKKKTSANPVKSNSTKIESFEDFAKKRLEGATKISNDAKEKGGVAILTYHHFVVKLPHYKNAAEGRFNLKEAKEELNGYMEELCGGKVQMDQIGFQRLVGLIEVLGELIIRHENRLNEKWTKGYKKSIDCNNPKGFSQKAHCAGRKARQAGRDTKSKSVN